MEWPAAVRGPQQAINDVTHGYGANPSPCLTSLIVGTLRSSHRCLRLRCGPANRPCNPPTFCFGSQAIIWDKKFRKYAEEYYKDGELPLSRCRLPSAIVHGLASCHLRRHATRPFATPHIAQAWQVRSSRPTLRPPSPSSLSWVCRSLRKGSPVNMLPRQASDQRERRPTQRTRALVCVRGPAHGQARMPSTIDSRQTAPGPSALDLNFSDAARHACMRLPSA